MDNTFPRKKYKMGKARKTNIKLMYANCRGLKSKIPCLKNILSELEPNIVLLTETHLTEDKGMNIDGFTFFGNARKGGKKGGGVCILVKNEMKTFVSPHYTKRDIEALWISVGRQSTKPLYIGVYYGKQESTSNKVQIEDEMEKLKDELMEIQCEGEVIVCMDANAKIGLMGEETSRNGKLIMQVFEECEMEVLNRSEKCKGVITRQNRKKEDEKSAIDFIVSTYDAAQWIKDIVIDEMGDFRLKGVNESDHNSILINVEIAKPQELKQTKRSIWNIRASSEKFTAFRKIIASKIEEAKSIMADASKPITERYISWEKLLYKAAISSIGKTTIKNNKKPETSACMKLLRQERRELKRQFEMEAGGGADHGQCVMSRGWLRARRSRSSWRRG